MTALRNALATTATLGCLALSALAAPAHAQRIQTVFVIAFENHDWIQPTHKFAGPLQQIKDNPHAPFINSLIHGTATATIDGVPVDISQQVAYTDTYHNVLATPNGHNPHIHPSEPNYIWSEAGSNLGILNDNDPYDPSGPTTRFTHLHLASLLTAAGLTWKSYQEDTDLVHAAGGLTNQPLPQNRWTVPLVSFSGNLKDGDVNAYNGHAKFSYAAKHNPQVFFKDTNGGDNRTPGNPESQHYAPLQQLRYDLASGNVANYNWITPDIYNDMHTELAGGFTPPGSSTPLTGDSAMIATGDNFARQIVPTIMASKAYQHGGVIVLWWDESENGDDFAHSMGEIIISPLAHPNVNGLPYDSIRANYSHSSDLLTWQEVFNVGPCLRDACNASDLSDLFAPGVIPHGIASE